MVLYGPGTNRLKAQLKAISVCTNGPEETNCTLLYDK